MKPNDADKYCAAEHTLKIQIFYEFEHHIGKIAIVFIQNPYLPNPFINMCEQQCQF
jgi:hypothetical protein